MRNPINAQKKDALEVVKIKNVSLMKVHAIVIIQKKNILAQINVENQDQAHVVKIIAFIVPNLLLIIMKVALALMMMILKA